LLTWRDARSEISNHRRPAPGKAQLGGQRELERGRLDHGLTIPQLVVRVELVRYYGARLRATYELVLLGVHTHAVADVLCR